MTVKSGIGVSRGVSDVLIKQPAAAARHGIRATKEPFKGQACGRTSKDKMQRGGVYILGKLREGENGAQRAQRRHREGVGVDILFGRLALFADLVVGSFEDGLH